MRSEEGGKRFADSNNNWATERTPAVAAHYKLLISVRKLGALLLEVRDLSEAGRSAGVRSDGRVVS